MSASTPPPSVSRPEGTLSAVLAATIDSRLHIAFALTGYTRLPAAEVLDLAWPQVSLPDGVLVTRCGVVRVSEPLADLLYWHATRQRMDRYRSRNAWSSDRVVVDERGEGYSLVRADNELALACRRAGLPILSLNALRHPVFGGAA